MVEVTQSDRDLLAALEAHAHCTSQGDAFLSDDALELIARHRSKERERCAKMADDYPNTGNVWARAAARDLAAAIRKGEADVSEPR